MKVLIAAGGDLGDIDFIKRSSYDWDIIICADGGARHLKNLGLMPQILVGDFDSISQKLLQEYKEAGVTILEYPGKKNRTDTQIAVDLAIEKGAKEVYLVGALGNRWDHAYANLMLLYRLEKKGIKATILNSHSTILMSNNTLNIDGKPGKVLSLLPFTGDVHISYTKGLAYPLEDFTLTLGHTLGVSNIMLSTKATIGIKRGWLIGVIAKD